MADRDTSITSRPAHQMQSTNVGGEVVKKTELANELGVSGTAILDGYLDTEYNSALKGTIGLETYDAMRKSDAQINATLQILELPVRATHWYIQPAMDEWGESSEEDREIAKFVEDALFKRMETTWDDFLREALTMLVFGHSVFEKVWEITDKGVFLRKLASRKQTTIQKWQLPNGKPGIVQFAPFNSLNTGKKNDIERQIPAGKLIIFTYRKEGDNWLGTSVLRSAYKHWFIKDQLYRFDLVRHERQSVGIPVVRMPKNWTETDKAEAEAIVQNVRATEQTGVVLPGSEEDGWDFYFADTQAGNSTPIFESINHHNREIAKNVLAQFLELGQESGSRALSEDHSDILMLCEDALARQIQETMNRFCIRELVDYNFNVEEDQYPTLQYDQIGFIDWNTFTSALATAAGANLLTPDDNTEAFLRKKLKLPPKQESAEDDEGLDEDGNPIDDEMDDGMEEEEDPEGGDDDLDSLLAEAEALDEGGDEFTEAAMAFCEEVEYQLDTMEAELELQMSAVDEGLQFVARGGTVPLAVRQKIAKTLRDKKMEYEPMKNQRQRRMRRDQSTTLNRKTGRSTKDLVEGEKAVAKRLEYQKGAITNRTNAYKAAAAGIRAEIDAIKAKGKVKKGALKPLLDKIRKLKAEADKDLKPLREMRAQDLKTRRQVKAIIKQRKAELKAKIQSIRDALKAKKITKDQALKPLKEQVKANSDQAKQIRDEIRKLGKGNKERKEALRDAVRGLMDENATVRDAARGIREEYGAAREAARGEIEKEKASSGLYSEGGDDDDMDPLEDEIEHHDHESHLYSADAAYQYISGMVNNQTILRLQNESRSAEDWARVKKKGFRFNEWEDDAWRPLTFAERKVNFKGVNDAMDTFEEKLQAQFDEITEKQKQDLIEQVKRAVENDDIAALGKIKAKYRGELSQAMTDIQKELFEIGRKGAATEMGVKLPPTRQEVKGAMRVANDAVVDGLINDLENDVKRVVTSEIAKNGGSITATNSATAVGAARVALDKGVDTAKRAATGLIISGALNLGRASIFERYPEKIYGFQFSAIMDSRTSAICMSLDGTVVPAGSPEYYDLKPPRHLHCRSIWVEILKEEAFKPKFTKVSKRIPRDQDLMQITPMKTPVLRKGAPAVKIIQQEIEERKAKLADLQKSGKYPNRQAQHQKRIRELESAIKGKFHDYVRGILAADGISFHE